MYSYYLLKVVYKFCMYSIYDQIYIILRVVHITREFIVTLCWLLLPIKSKQKYYMIIWNMLLISVSGSQRTSSFAFETFTSGSLSARSRAALCCSHVRCGCDTQHFEQYSCPHAGHLTHPQAAGVCWSWSFFSSNPPPRPARATSSRSRCGRSGGRFLPLCRMPFGGCSSGTLRSFPRRTSVSRRNN